MSSVPAPPVPAVPVVAPPVPAPPVVELPVLELDAPLEPVVDVVDVVDDELLLVALPVGVQHCSSAGPGQKPGVET